ncbi:hypothetical protein ACIPVK_08105 [Paeniglutamicibacter sp. MACA_103]|uniref:hypothetical protein n=1 Tax=Paeniglutamicibacter sp. MACA_103 TaxID=3377337 RepID=UPI003893E1F9
MTASSPQENGVPPRGRKPVVTWTLMLLAVAITLLLPDWSGTGALLPAWFMAAPMILGLVGAWLAWRAGSMGWAIASGLLGLVLVPGLLQTVTLVSGP